MIEAIHRAKYVLAAPAILMHNAAVHVLDTGRISRVEPWLGSASIPKAQVVDWGSAVIMPGLINAHTHLELTSLHNQVTHFSSFTDWIFQLISRRREWTRDDFLTSIRDGARLSLSFGTTLVGDITASGLGWAAAAGDHLRRVVFEETLALSSSQADQALSQLERLLERTDPHHLLEHGVSPHATYSVSPELFRRTAQLARGKRMLLATHAAETRAELQFLQDGTGEFREFLGAAGVLPNDWEPPEQPPIHYLDSLGVLGQFCILSHCNYLDRESITRISATRSNVVYCPRSHAFFDHEEHPIRQLLDCGVNVALGTDSLASNSSLSMLDEMRFLYEKRKDIKPEEIFRAATLSGAAALGFGDSLGLLKRGHRADMAVLKVPRSLKPRQLISQILEGAGECIGAVVEGQTAWRKPGFGEFNTASRSLPEN
jgi:cytosine/adenosine deaminase-related metal-dependent hydrolase